MASQPAGSGADQFAEAYRALRSDPSVQFNLQPPPPAPKPPAWLQQIFDAIGSTLKPVGRFINWITSFMPDAPYARILLWTVIAVAAAAFAWAVYVRLKDGEWRLRLPRFKSGEFPEGDEEEWSPAESGARSWLEEADGLAQQGLFAEAIHHLLFRSVEDIARRRPALVRPALTSRELACADAIPSRARNLFSRIAGLVERSLFGGREVNEKDWAEARQAYSEFALAGSWRA